MFLDGFPKYFICIFNFVLWNYLQMVDMKRSLAFFDVTWMGDFHGLPLFLLWQKTRCFIVAKLLVKSMTSFKSELCYMLPFQKSSTNYRFAFWLDSRSSAVFSLHLFHHMQTHSDWMTLWFGPQCIFYKGMIWMYCTLTDGWSEWPWITIAFM